MNKINNLIFLDFAKTLGFRVTAEIDTDFLILSEITKGKTDISKSLYQEFVKKSNLYDRSLRFNNFSNEKQFTKKHFFKFFMSLGVGSKSASILSTSITNKKYSTLCHRLYSEVERVLKEYKKVGMLYVLSDGRPSRRLTLDQLGLSKYCQGYFVSDELGVMKNNVNFYRKVLEKVKIFKNIIFIDDLIINLDTFDSVTRIKGYFLDRHGVNKKYTGNFVYTSQLPRIVSPSKKKILSGLNG